MACQYPSSFNQFLNGIEAIGKIFWVGNSWHVVAHIAKALCEGTTAQTLIIEREVDVIERRVFVVNKYRRHHFAHIRDLGATANDNRSRGDNLLAVGILLGHR